MDREKAKRRGLILGALAAGAGAGLAVERYLVGRERARPDPEASEPFGSLRGRATGPVASFDGTRLHLEEAGEGVPTIVFAHGFSLNLTSWHYQIRDLARERRLVLYDQRGHGRSGRPPSGDWSLEALARDLGAVIDAAGGPGPVAVVGHSMGGMAALKFCELYPEQIGTRVCALVLVNTTAADVMGGMLPGAATRRVEAALQAVREAAMRVLASNTGRVERLRRRTSDLAYLGVRLMGFGPAAPPSQVGFVERMLAGTPTEVWASLLPTLMGIDVTGVLDVIDVPTLVVAGTHDRLTPPGAAERIAGAIKGAELVVIQGAGHLSMLERPHSFNARLRAFLQRVPGFA